MWKWIVFKVPDLSSDTGSDGEFTLIEALIAVGICLLFAWLVFR